MRVHSSAAAILLLAAVQAFAQNTPAAGSASPNFAPASPATAYARPPRMPMTAARSSSANIANPLSLRQRAEEMDSTVSKMHELLEQMRKRAALSKDSSAKANLELWTLMVNHLDAELKDLKISMAVREDMEARRTAMYKQADAKAQAEAAQAARKFAVPQPPAGGQVTPSVPAAASSTGTQPK